MKKASNLRVKLLFYLSGFVFLILILIYLFQVVFLDYYYKDLKIKEIRDINKDIFLKMTGDTDQFYEYLANKSSSADVSIKIIYKITNKPIQYINVGIPGSSLLLISDSDILKLIYETKNSNTNDLLTITPHNSRFYSADNNVDVFNIFGGSDTINNYTYSKYYQINDAEITVVIESVVYPVNSTITTIKSQFYSIIIIVAFLTIILAMLLSFKIVKPIRKIIKAAKSLDKGEYVDTKTNNDYLEIKELNQTLLEANKRITAADRMKRDLLANVSHDLRTPLTMIGGYAEMMRDLPGENTPENAEVIINESKRLSNLVEDLLDLSKLQDNIIKLNKSIIDTDSLLNDLFKQYTKLSNNHDYEFKIELNENCNIECDVKRIKQVLYNFINNAINYSKDEKYVKIRQSIVDNYCLIEIIDKGEGISPEAIPHIWNRYYKIRSDHIRANMGSGIGLAISREILEAHHFKYGVNSKLNKGSTFYFKVPIII